MNTRLLLAVVSIAAAVLTLSSGAVSSAAIVNPCNGLVPDLCQQPTSTLTTQIQYGGGGSIPAPGSDGYSHVAAFSTLRDQATLTFSGGSRKPYGVTTTTFYNGTLACDNVGTTVGIFTSFPLQPALGFPSTDLISGPEGPLQPGNYSFRATYSGGWGYPPATSACEPVVVDTIPRLP